ncbi:putative Ser-Thr-rich glycosyl-phosphatidyl-inositol-anchored membrane protein [Elsinoe fawcettii]|nr:putative Ser-Thr-rich glycosyl-phosphatidyl-inositol-anchored membrane protein [Elsinoe fawcettii]
MKFSATALVAFLASPLLVLAQNPNPFNIPTTGLTASAGQSVTLTWNPTTQGTVSLILRSGASNALAPGEPIAQSIPNSGSYTWSVPSSIVRGSDYAIEIVSDSNRDQVNYTPPFVIESTNTVRTSSAVSSGSASASGTTRTGSTSGTATTGSTTGTASTTASGTTGSTTGTASTSGTSSRNTASTSGAGFQSTSSSASAQSTGGAPRATAAAGMMGLIALGAMAL